MAEMKKNEAASPAILEICGLQKSFGELNVLKDISLDVEPGNPPVPASPPCSAAPPSWRPPTAATSSTTASMR